MSTDPSSPFGRIGVFGSLFNPPHVGHLVLCAEAAWQLGLERVILVPTGIRPTARRPPSRPTCARGWRWRRASTDPVLTVSRVEVDRPGPSYMVDTLRELQRRHAGHGLVLLLGADQLAALDKWYRRSSCRSSPASRSRAGRGWRCAASTTPRSRSSTCRRSASRRRGPRAGAARPPHPPPRAGARAGADRVGGPVPHRSRCRRARGRGATVLGWVGSPFDPQVTP